MPQRSARGCRQNLNAPEGGDARWPAPRATISRRHLVAEGIETEAELDTLRALGVTVVQGYLLGRPQALWPAVTMPGRAVAPDRDAPAASAITLHDAQA